MPNLAPILYSADDPRNGGVAETINADAAPSLNAAFEQIHAESGIKPIVLRDLGGDRTEAQQAGLVRAGKSDTMNSDHRGGDFPTRAAADIDNHERLRSWNEARFLQIMADHGWHNMTNSGASFPTEKWHFAKHSIAPAESTPPTPVQEEEEDDDMNNTGITTFHNAESGETAIAAPWIASDTDPKQSGYVITTDGPTGLAWQRLYGKGSGTNSVSRDDYVAMQAQARFARTLFLAAVKRGEVV